MTEVVQAERARVAPVAVPEAGLDPFRELAAQADRCRPEQVRTRATSIAQEACREDPRVQGGRGTEALLEAELEGALVSLLHREVRG